MMCNEFCVKGELLHLRILKTVGNVVANIKIDLKGIGWQGMNWIDLAEDRNEWWALIKAMMNLMGSTKY
jgi:hypothetical protein